MVPATSPIDHDLLCGACGHNLRGTDGTRCPECGVKIDPTVSPDDVLPWILRKRIGRVRAYLRTVWWVSFRHKKVARQMDRPMLWSDARRFWIVTSILAAIFVPLAAWACEACYFAGFTLQNDRQDFESSISALIGSYPEIAITLIGSTLAIFACAGVASYFFQPRRLSKTQQARAGAIGLYACAPLVWLAIPAALIPFSLAMPYFGWKLDMYVIHLDAAMLQFLMEPVLRLAVYLLAAILGWWWFTILRLLRLATRAGVAKILIVSILLPTIWIALPLISILALHFIVNYIALMLLSRIW